MRRREEEALFSSGELRSSLEEERRKLKAEIDGASENYLLNTDIDDWVAHLVDEYTVDVPVIRADEMVVEDEGEIQTDVSHEYITRAIFDPSTPTYVPGRRVRARIPFTGESILFRLRGSSWSMNPPRAIVAEQDLQLVFEYPTDRRPDIKGEVDSLIRRAEPTLANLRSQCETFHSGLEDEARRLIEDRRARVLADHAHLDNLGIPVRKRGDAPRTYQAPAVKKRSKPNPAVPKSKPTSPEPTLVKELYAHTLEVIGSATRAMERTPGDYARANEEKLRDFLLIVLNTHYEGQGQAEAFNKGGKTDILIRVEDRNIFIGECKVWKGERSLVDGLEQLFSYATWRDTKLSLIVFVRQKAMAPIIEKARSVLARQTTFGEWREAGGGELCCTMGWPGDADSRADLAVFFVHLAAVVGKPD
jgi:hypothetical protein